MKIIKNSEQNNRMLRLVALLLVIFASNLFAMDEMEKKAAKVHLMKTQLQAYKNEQDPQTTQKARKDKYFIYENSSGKGIWIDKDVANGCKAIQSMVNDIDDEVVQIPLTMPLDTIKLVFGVLCNKINIHKISLKHLVAIANAFNFLDAPIDSMDAVLAAIKIDIDKNSKTIVSNEFLKELHPDLQKMVMVVPVIEYLQALIIEKDLNGRKRILIGHPSDVLCVAFSPDGKKIVSGGAGYGNNLILWDISDPNNIIPHPLTGHPADVLSVAFTQDGMRIVSVVSNLQNPIIVWDITDVSDITSQSLVDSPEDIFVKSTSNVSFSLNNKKMVMISQDNGNNLVVIDTINPHAITQLVLTGHSNPVMSLAFSPDGTMIVSGSAGDENNLIVWLLLTDQEESLVNNVPNYSADQVRLLYQLCLQSLHREKIILKQGSDQQKIVNTLPSDMQQLVTDLFFPKGFFSGWWQ